MASAVQSLRLCFRAASRRPVASAIVASRPRLVIRPFSSTPLQRHPAASKNDDNDNEDELERELYEDEDQEELSPAEMQRVLAEMRNDKDYDQARQLQERVLNDLNAIFIEASRPPPFLSRLFWAEEEPDPEMMIEESEEDKFNEDDIMSLAHGKFEEYREFREYARIAAWQMPLLSKLATPFEAPTIQEPLRFRYTSYMGEFHPAEKKVVVEFSPRDMPLSEGQQQKLRKLLGPRWNPETDIAKMSCEQFEHQAQNKRYLGDLVDKLVEQAKDPTDTFEDVPLDTRHHVFKVKPKFPKEWRMTEERRKFIDDTREKSLLLDQKKEEEGTLIVGAERIHLFFNPPPSATTDTARIREPEMASARLDRSLAASLLTRRQQQIGNRR